MKKVLVIAAAIIVLAGSGTALYAVPSAPDIDVPDVAGVPDVGSGTPQAPGVGTGRGVVTSRRPGPVWTSTPAAQATTMPAIPGLVFGAGVSGTFTDEEMSSPYLALYMDWYPLVIAKVFGIGSTLTCDVVPAEDGNVVFGIQADARWVFASMRGLGAAWVDCRVGPSYETNTRNLCLYGYGDVGFDLDIGGMYLDTRLGLFLTGTGVGFMFGMGMSL